MNAGMPPRSTTTAVTIWRPMDSRVRVYLPYAAPGTTFNKTWLREVLGRRIQPEHQRPDWYVPASHYRRLVDAVVDRWGEVTVHEQYAVVGMCTGKCMQASPLTVDDLACVCGGRNHAGGVGRYGWLQVGDDLYIESERFWRTFMVGPVRAGR